MFGFFGNSERIELTPLPPAKEMHGVKLPPHIEAEMEAKRNQERIASALERIANELAQRKY